MGEPSTAHVFIFRRDLRASDNTGLLACCRRARARGEAVYPVFVFDPDQADPERNRYFSRVAFDAMLMALRDLKVQLPALSCLRVAGGPAALEALQARLGAARLCVWYNVDVTPFAKRRDAEIRAWCEATGNAVRECEDYSLLPRGSVQNRAGKAYRVFTPFYRHCATLRPREPEGGRAASYPGLRPLPEDTPHLLPRPPGPSGGAAPGQRAMALRVLRRLRRGKSDYEAARHLPCVPTTRLSVHLKFGTISVREFHRAVVAGGHLALQRQSLWREFHFHLFDAFPGYLGAQVGQSSAASFREPAWRAPEDAEEDVLRWKAGETGVPVVDAAMRRLAEQGYLHNRERMIVASYLVFHLRVDWRVGEHHFATQLADYDPAQNNAGWREVARTPAFRRLQPAVQARKIEAGCPKSWLIINKPAAKRKEQH